MGTHSSGDPFGPLYSLLDQIQGAHHEMGQMVQEYKALVERLEERTGEDDLKLVRVLPGARYTVGTTFVREAWLKVQVEVGTLFPEEESS